jgi:hypothetical protein
MSQLTLSQSPPSSTPTTITIAFIIIVTFTFTYVVFMIFMIFIDDLTIAFMVTPFICASLVITVATTASLVTIAELLSPTNSE